MKKLTFILLLAMACGRERSVAGVAPAEQPIVAAQPQQRAAAPRMIVRTADVRIVVADTSKTVAAVTKSIEGAGGYVAGSNLWREGELLRGRLTLRVPADQLTAALAAIRAQAKRVESETIKSEPRFSVCWHSASPRS